jgi:uncharacterized membrane protein YeiH
MKYDSDKLLVVLDLAGILVFGVEGALAAIGGDLDFFGLMVLAFTTALAGGIIRDLLIGAIPPQSLRDWRYGTTAFVGGALVFFLHEFVLRIPGPLITVMDAAGLSLFAMAGTVKALDYRMHPFVAILLGGITGVGGGTVRDVFLAQVPNVLRSDIYATAALAGAAVMLGARKLRVPPVWAAILGGVVCFVLRMVSVWRHWNLPHVM